MSCTLLQSNQADFLAVMLSWQLMAWECLSQRTCGGSLDLTVDSMLSTNTAFPPVVMTHPEMKPKTTLHKHFLAPAYGSPPNPKDRAAKYDLGMVC